MSIAAKCSLLVVLFGVSWFLCSWSSLFVVCFCFLSGLLLLLVSGSMRLIIGYRVSAPSRCILVLFEQYGRPKKCAQKSSCNTFFIFHVKTKWNIVYDYLKKNLFQRHKYRSPKALKIKYFWTLRYNHWEFSCITKLCHP